MPKTIIANGYAGELAVPLWGRFMAAATRADAPDRFTMPATVVPVMVDRLSGLLPTDACRGAIVYDSDGLPTDKSMVYTEYFVRGTEPTDYCPLHSRPFDTIATSGDGTRPAVAASSGDAGKPALPPADRHEAAAPGADARLGDNPATAGAQPASSAPASTPRKRGFWGRLFGR
jgi:penicillin-binding protein 1A